MNFPPGTGYAWATIERVIRGVADRLAARGDSVLVSYPGLSATRPAVWEGSAVELVELDYDASWQSASGFVGFLRWLRQHRVDALYLTDRPTWALRNPLLHLAGIRLLVVHDRTSGDRANTGVLAGLGKRLFQRLPGFGATAAIAVSK